ncbi:MAG: site-2 protease family protein [Bacteroidetes bacterium]|nr:site-2 protease family protein [Bacteroidota bacterium]
MSDTARNGAPEQGLLAEYRQRQDAAGTEAETRDRYWLHILLFVVTFVSTAFTGAQFVGRFLLYEQAPTLFTFLGLPISWPFLADGLIFAFALLLFLTVHEFGHYIAARQHGVATSLPYYIPAPLIGIGTFGAVIRIREPVPSLRKLFDIGAAGPIAGFVVALGVLVYALATLPPPEYLMDQPGHEALKEFIRQYGTFPETMPPAEDPALEGQRLMVGNTLLYWALTQLVPNTPPMYEMYHYPVLFAGWLGLFFTALNLLPVGQLDGGHVTYALFGKVWHRRIARGFTLLLLASAAIGFIRDGADLILAIVPALEAYAGLVGSLTWFVLAALLYPFLSRIFNGDQRLIAPWLLGLVLLAVAARVIGPAATQLGYLGWFVWCGLLVFFVRIEHPPVLKADQLTPRRRALGLLSILIFVLCFSLKPLYFV